MVGTLLALLVFFALFGIFITQYVPLWMTDNESGFTSEASASFANFKAGVDDQYILNGPPTYGTSFTISSGGVPLLAQPTEGTLLFLPTTCPAGFNTGSSGGTIAGQPVHPTYCVFENITLSAGPGGSGLYSQHVPSGVLEMVLPNRYYSAETFYFEDDAVVQSQGGPQQILALPPPLSVTTVTGNTSVATSFLQLYGNASTVIGQGAEQVFSHLRYSQTVSSNGGGTPFTLTFEIGTQYPCAWSHYLQSLMSSSGVAASHYVINAWANWTSPASSWTSPTTVPNSACTGGTGQTTVLRLQIQDVNYATVFYAGAQVSLGIGGT